MISRITDLKVSLYFAAISASTAFVQREASIYGTSFAIVLALWRSLAKALWQFLSESTSKNHSRVRNSARSCLSAAISVLYVLVFCLKAHAQPGIDQSFGLSTVPVAETAIAAAWKGLLIEITNDLSIVRNCRETMTNGDHPWQSSQGAVATANTMQSYSTQCSESWAFHLMP